MQRRSSLVTAIYRIWAVAIMVSAVLCSSASWQQQKNNYKDASGNLRVWNGSDWIIELGDNNLITFQGIGKPIYGESKSQGLHVEANSVSGVLKKNGQTTTIQSLTLEGATKAVVTRSSASNDPKANQQIDLQAPKAVYQATEEKWTLTGGVSVHRTDAAVGEDTLLKGTGAVITLYPNVAANKNDLGIKQAHLDSATLAMKTRRRDDSTGQPQWKSYRVDGKADNMDYDGEKRELVLKGNVHLTGDDPIVGGQMDADKVTITFNAQGQPIRIHGEGNPGVTTLQKKGSGGTALISDCGFFDCAQDMFWTLDPSTAPRTCFGFWIAEGEYFSFTRTSLITHDNDPVRSFAI